MTPAKAEVQGEAIATTKETSEAGRQGRFLLWLRALTCIALIFTFGNALWAAWDQSQTLDEFYHLKWARRLLQERVDERDSAFRYDSKTPALLPAALALGPLQRLGVDSDQALLFAGRVIPLVYLALSLVLVALLARRAGPPSAWLAVLLVALDPSLAAHASIATSDVGYTFAVLLLAWAMVRANETWTSELLIGAAIGTAFAIKYTAVLLIPVALAHAALRGPRSVKSLVRRIAVMTAAALVTVNCLYLMVGVGTPLGSLPFRTPLFHRLAEAMPSLRLPLPGAILTGIDMSMAHNDDRWNIYILGEIHRGGVWYYFVANWLMKTPVALVLGVAVGLWQMRHSWRNYWVGVLGALFTIHLIYFSFFFPTQLGLRYALLCIPLASIIAGAGLARLATRSTWWLLPLVVLALAERTPYWGDPIAFTNLSVWPKSRAYWYVSDSNLDHGQNRDRLARYVKESGLAMITDQPTVTPGWYVIGGNDLTHSGNFSSHRWLLEQNIPAINVGFTHFAFSITGERFEDYMNDSRVVPEAAGFDDTCSGELPHYAPGSRIPFARTDHPDGGRLWVVCVRSRKGVDIGFSLEEGRVFFGRVVNETTCAIDFLKANQTTWVRVPPGAAVRLCLREFPLTRTFLPYSTKGALIVRGQGADVEFRKVATDLLGTTYEQEDVP